MGLGYISANSGVTVTWTEYRSPSSCGSAVPWNDVDLIPLPAIKKLPQTICAYCGTPCKDEKKEKCTWCGAPLIDQ